MRIAWEFCVATPEGATSVANDTFSCFLGVLKHTEKGVEEG